MSPGADEDDPADRDHTPTLLKALDLQGAQIRIWLRLSEGWTDAEKATVLISWMGTTRAVQMNRHLMDKYPEKLKP